jgi:hypothetical protein
MTKIAAVNFYMITVIGMLIHAFVPVTGCDNKQGIYGYVYRISGNQMPSPQRKTPTLQGIQSTVFVYEITNIKQVVRQGQSPFYLSINTRPVAETVSDSTGYFKLMLAPGRYSLFTKKGPLFYANWFDKDNNIAPIDVSPGKMTKTEIRVDYDAAY